MDAKAAVIWLVIDLDIVIVIAAKQQGILLQFRAYITLEK